jgi:Zn-dependent protease/predicted transcriptional regulator
MILTESMREKGFFQGAINQRKGKSMMRGGLRIGRIFGIEIDLNWSLIFIFLLITWSLASGFEAMHNNWSTGLSWGVAIVAAILFFASILAHELAHSLVARTQGVPVRRITLFLFGGVSDIQREPPSPTAEFLITIVGPLTSIILGIIFIAVSSIPLNELVTSSQLNISTLSSLTPIQTLLFWLGPINILLGIFNLVPGFPLDGGRVLRSILWAATDNLRRATRLASYAGQGVGWLMIAGGIAMVLGVQLPFFGTGLINGIWLAFIGWFLNTAASSSYRQIIIHDILQGIPVERMMQRDVPTVGPDICVSDLVHDHIMRSDDHAFPVLEANHLIGLVTLDDVRSVSRELWDTKSIRDIMTPRDSADALGKLSENDIRQLPVMKGADMVGLLRRRDILKWLQLHAETMKS